MAAAAWRLGAKSAVGPRHRTSMMSTLVFGCFWFRIPHKLLFFRNTYWGENLQHPPPPLLGPFTSFKVGPKDCHDAKARLRRRHHRDPNWATTRITALAPHFSARNQEGKIHRKHSRCNLILKLFRKLTISR